MRIYTILVNGSEVMPKAYKTYGEALENILPFDLKDTKVLGQGFFAVNDTTYRIVDVYVED